MSAITTPTRSGSTAMKLAGTAADEVDSRIHPAGGIRRQINKVFPTHWSFMLGEIAMYSFIVLLLSGTWLAVFYDPSMAETTYEGVYPGLRGVTMSMAYESTVNISMEVRGGLFIRQVHHWAALLFVAAMIAHMMRTFFTGAFRRPRETNWVLGVVLLLTGMIEGFIGYSLPDDLLSGTGIRTGLSAIVMSIPVIGTWLQWAIMGGEFPGHIIIPRLYIVHVFLLPGIILAVIGVHVALVWFQKHTQFPGPGRTERNVVGVRILPTFAAKAGGFMVVSVGIMAIMSGVFQINPIWKLGPYDPTQVSAGSQPDFYMAVFDGAVRLWPSWEMYLGNYMIPAVFFPAVLGFGVLVNLLIAYPVIERKLTGDEAHHNLLQRPRDVPVRTATGTMALSFYFWLVLACGNDIFAYTFDISLNVMTWIGRIGLLVIPPVVYFATYRICLGLQRSDREVLEHGIETGHIKRLPHGEFIEVHQPLGGVDDHGHAIPVAYQGAKVPKRMNDLGFSGSPVKGGWFRPDPAEEQDDVRGVHGGTGTDPLQVEPTSGRELAGRPDAGRPRDVRE
ncbi:cytochrome bc complex cytochrome b subunit [Actinomycetospora sp. NBRC 106378]|jgi:ubiquinol-cytochrome c reductase cytochrome b subunit|uniref:cytochrome bc1 complex cytochrome b subunit n=1 Tax=Actinomycetospora sp. NBRC 106378 TaxID=3032208 RepID=UPI0025564139|nr:cytochrome bc complex cytochrome b subunit [Actinomycetospora sp. NBRC 106378]